MKIIARKIDICNKINDKQIEKDRLLRSLLVYLLAKIKAVVKLFGSISIDIIP